MKLLLKVLGLDKYIADLERLQDEDTNTITELYDKTTKLAKEVAELKQLLQLGK